MKTMESFKTISTKNLTSSRRTGGVGESVTDLMRQLLKTFQPVPPVKSAVLKELYIHKDYAKMLGWIKNSMRLNLCVGLRIVNTVGHSVPLWVEMPPRMPLFGSPEFRSTRVIVNVRGDFLTTKSFRWIVSGFAHELAHVVLASIDHGLKQDERAVDLTAMILGYQNFVANANSPKMGDNWLWVLL